LLVCAPKSKRMAENNQTESRFAIMFHLFLSKETSEWKKLLDLKYEKS
jgi:hypothetical protein